MADRWSNLPEDLLRTIVSRMYLIDQIRSVAVCKAWNRRHIFKDLTHRDKLPWLMQYDWAEDPVCKLFVPSEDKTYTVKVAYMGEDPKTFVGAEACDSKHGWVLFSREKRGKEYSGVSVLFFAFSPFANKIVKLPELKKDFQKATFSSTPTSQNCVFFASNYGRDISIYNNGDPTWKTINLEDLLGSNYIVGCTKDMAYLSGSFYCIFSGGTLGFFNVYSQLWSVLKYCHGESMRGSDMEYDYLMDSDNLGDDVLIESDGSLLKLRLDHYCGDGTWNIERFDFSENKWVEETSVGDKAIFVNSTTFSFSIPALGEARKLADTVTFYGLGWPRDYSTLRTYSFKTGAFIDPFKPYVGVLEDGPKNILLEPPIINFTS